ncbi:MAG: hypothetical protein ACLGHU_09930, partial [Alphaproteobacteria bacterium]
MALPYVSRMGENYGADHGPRRSRASTLTQGKDEAMAERVKVDEGTVAALVADQFPQWANLPV